MKTMLKPSGEIYAEHRPGPVEWTEGGSFGGSRFVAMRANEGGGPAGAVAAALQPPALVNPLAPPTISGTTFTIDFALQNPTRVITPMLIDLTLQRFFVDRVFASGGGVTGGAVIFSVLEGNDLYAARDVQRIAPGDEYPILTFQRRAPQVATVEKWGGKIYITWEARDRNNISEFTNGVRQLANTLVRKINQRGVEQLEAAITANSRTVTGISWGNATTLTETTRTPATMPARDFAKAAMLADVDELGIEYNLWIMNPTEYMNLAMAYGDSLNDVLDAHNIDIFVTNRVTAGTAYAVAEQQVGEMRLEQPLTTRSWDDADGIEQTWVQSSVRPLFFVNNPFAVLKFTGLT